jgi:hypothetical protein
MWRTSDNNRRARYYILTREGARQLATETSLWERASGAVNDILQVRPAPARANGRGMQIVDHRTAFPIRSLQ